MQASLQVAPYLFFNGDCEAAVRFYAQCFGGNIAMMMRHSDAPAGTPIPEGSGKLIMHARLELPGGPVLMASDEVIGQSQPRAGFRVSLSVKEVAEAERLYQALSQDGTVEMPLQATFWSARFAMFSDRFGTPWMINCELPA
ncbi:MAG: VOC family protein [Nevskiales bacterium]